MAKSVAVRRHRLPRVNPRVALVGLLALGLLGYYGILGIRYWQATRQVDLASRQLPQLSASLEQKPPDQQALAAALKSGEEELEGVTALFSYPETDKLVAIVSTTAQEAGVGLLQVMVGDPQVKVRGAIQYRAQPMTVRLEGERERLYRFLARLQEKVPVMAVSGIGLSSLDSSPGAQVQLFFYLSPQAVAEKQGAK